MKPILYLNCFAGIAGDMTLGVLLDLLGKRDLKPFLEGLALEGWDVTVQQGLRSGLSGLDVKVHCSEGHVHRGLADVLQIIEKSDLAPAVVRKASSAFRLLAEAEGAVHGRPPEEIHFHEVGAVDAIVDIVGSIALMEVLSPGEVVASAVNVGSGTVRCAHGEFPVPSPAALKLLEGIPVYGSGEPLERTTPTGAVLLRTFVDRFGPLPCGVVLKSGYGLGDSETDLPNALQGILLQPRTDVKKPSSQRHCQKQSPLQGHDHDHDHGHDHDHDHDHDSHPHGPLKTEGRA